MDNKKSAKGVNEFLGPALALFGRFTGWILVPVFLGATLGIYLDKRFGTDPWFFLITIGISFVVSMVGMARNALSEYKKIKDLDKENK